MANKTHLEFTDPWSIYEDRQAGIFAWVIMGLMFGFFFGMIVRDMVLKSRTKELQSELKTFGQLGLLIVRLPCMLFTKDNFMPVWYACTNIFRSQENKRYWKKEEEEDKATGPLQFDSKAIIARLGGGWPVGHSQNSSDRGSDIKDKDIEMQRLPNVVELAAAPTGLPKIEKLAVVFEVPEILPSNKHEKDDGFQPAPVHGSGSGANSLPQLTSIFNFESSQDQRGKPTLAVKEITSEKQTGAEDETSTKDDKVSNTEKTGESSRAEDNEPDSPSAEPESTD
jgi:hypothetical protein